MIWEIANRWHQVCLRVSKLSEWRWYWRMIIQKERGKTVWPTRCREGPGTNASRQDIIRRASARVACGDEDNKVHVVEPVADQRRRSVSRSQNGARNACQPRKAPNAEMKTALRGERSRNSPAIVRENSVGCWSPMAESAESPLRLNVLPFRRKCARTAWDQGRLLPNVVNSWPIEYQQARLGRSRLAKSRQLKHGQSRIKKAMPNIATSRTSRTTREYSASD